jgi:FKBP-type peptidyl-prolyl cis-trans isomerase
VPKGFSEIEKGISYKLVISGDGKTSPHKGDFVKINAKGSGLPKDWELFRDEEGLDTFTYGRHKELAFLEKLIANMVEGDSCVFNFDPLTMRSGLFKTNTKIGIRLLTHKSAEQVKKESLSHDLWLRERYEDEARMLQNYLDENYEGLKPDSSGIVFISLEPGTEAQASTGDNVFVEYSGSFLSGKEFYSTRNSEPFEFTIGQQGQALQGMEMGVKRMRQGEKARIIVPSHLAFGESGASTGIVGPFKTIIFDVELVKIIHKPNS